MLGGGSDVTAPALYLHICPFQFVTAESSSAAVGGPAGKYLQNMLVPIFSNCLGCGCSVLGTNYWYTLELETKVPEDFTITEKAPTSAFIFYIMLNGR